MLTQLRHTDIAARPAAQRADGQHADIAPAPGLFRQEALEAAAHHSPYGEVIRISPHWSDLAYWVILAVVLAALSYAALTDIARYSSGPAVVHVVNHVAITAHIDATVGQLHVAPAQHVKRGEVLVSFYDAAQRATVDLLQHEFATQLRNRLLDPSNQAAKQAVSTLRVELERARAALAERAVRAPHDGMVSDVRVHPGQHVASGDRLLSILHAESTLYIDALLPGGDRPQLAPGMPLRLAIAGYPYAYQWLTIDTVSSEVMGPSEARRFLGPQIGDAIAIPGPVVLVRASLPSHEFAAAGQRYHYHDGMQAHAEVRLQAQRLLRLLLPGMERR